MVDVKEYNSAKPGCDYSHNVVYTSRRTAIHGRHYRHCAVFQNVRTIKILAVLLFW
jgi:predicted nuclease of restriction endonuclease-like (RecB) superfamily